MTKCKLKTCRSTYQSVRHCYLILGVLTGSKVGETRHVETCLSVLLVLPSVLSMLRPSQLLPPPPTAISASLSARTFHSSVLLLGATTSLLIFSIVIFSNVPLVRVARGHSLPRELVRRDPASLYVCCTQEHDGDDPFYSREFHISMRHYVY